MWSSKNYRGRGRYSSNNSVPRPRGRGRAQGNNTFYESSNTDNTPCKSSITSEKPDSMNISLNLDLDPVTETWFNSVQKLCVVWKQPQNINDILNSFLSNVTNPFLTILKILFNYSDNKNTKIKNVVILIMEEFKKWLSKQSPEYIDQMLTSDIQLTCFNVIYANKNSALIKLAANIYHLEMIKDQLLDSVKYLISTNHYKEACQIVTILKYNEELFSVEDFVIPLLLQDKLGLVEEYLEQRPKSQLETVQFLDRTLDRKSSVHNILGTFITSKNITGIRYEKIHPKPISKLLSRFLKLYKIPDQMAPNMNRKRVQGLINFLVHKRFIDNSLGDESWSEMVMEAIRNEKNLQQDFIYAVCVHDLADALKWARTFNIDKKFWPVNLSDYEESSSETNRKNLDATDNRATILNDEDWTKNWNMSPSKTVQTQFHTFPLSMSSIILIDNEVLFQKLLDTGLMGVTLVGIDCEWKPSFASHQTALSLVQIATKHLVFILDVITLGNQVPHLWRRLATEFFNNINILKLGFGLTTDISMLQQNLPHLLNVYMQGAGYIDLLTLWKELIKTKHFKFPFPNETLTGSSLTQLVELCIGTRLNKSEQFSNWENRPLRESQLIYASIDAYCLIEVFETIQEKCDAQNIPFDDLCNKIMYDVKVKSKKPKRKKSVSKNNVDTNKKEEVENLTQKSHLPAKQNTVRSVRFVCDTMVQGLGKALRKCGIDTIILDSYTHHDECVKIANREQRYILTRGTIFNKLRQYVPEGHCYRVSADNLDDQLKEVLDFYRIEVRKEDIFSRCQVCNAANFMKLTQQEMKNEIEHQKKTKVVCSLQCEFDDDPQWLDEATGFSSDEDSFDEGTSAPICKTGKPIPTESQFKIDVDSIPSEILDRVELFYVCRSCGKVYWDGSHLDRILMGRLQNIVIKESV